MKLLILTTQTMHHTKFVQDIAARWPEVKVVIETRTLQAPFDTTHEYLARQDEYEQKIWFNGGDPQIKDLVETTTVVSVNDKRVADLITGYKPDLIVVFGTGKILPHIINLVPGRIINLHGGDPEHYRGLDTHLWAVYHGEYDQLVTCLHEVAPDLDTGAIISRARIPLGRNMELFQLRAENTKICIDLVQEAMEVFEKRSGIKTLDQRQKGRYYSFMPAVLKELCVKKFRRFTRDLS